MFLQYLCRKSLVGASKYQQFKRMKVLKFEELQLKLMAIRTQEMCIIGKP